MLEQIAKVVKTAKPRHLLKGVRSPSHTIRAIKYHYRRVSEREFVEFLAERLRCTHRQVESAYREFNKNSTLWKEIENKLSSYPNGYGLQMTRERLSLYILVRLLKPDRIIETGVASGSSSAYLLCALRDNKKGKLYSIDLPPDNLPTGKCAGWIVPDHLRDYWSLHIGDSKELLKPLLEEIGEIDCFVHDSLHTYEHMIWEFRTVWEYIRPNGLFLSHDVGTNEAFFDFMKEKGIPWSSYRVFHVLGGFQKP